MKNLIYFLIGVFLILLTSATTAGLMTVKPAKPRYTIIKHIEADDCRWGESVDDIINKYVKPKLRSGWQLKSITGGIGSNHDESWIIILEKY